MSKYENITVLTPESSLYPDSLRGIKDPPKSLYCIGDLSLLGSRCVAMVGSRKTTQYGRNTARQLAEKVASRGITIVSGMAAGIDTCAHQGALKCDGATIAVLGCGPDICYPTFNEDLKRQIEETGLIVSEYPPGTEPMPYHFPMRNRIISGLSYAAVVLQAGMRSGAVITAEHAMDQGKAVYAVPGNIDSQYNLGSNKLIQDGAEIVLTAGDLLDKLALSVVSEEEEQRIFSDEEKRIYDLLSAHGEMTTDELCRMTEMKAYELMPLLSVMELKGMLFSDMGKIFVAKY